MLCNSYTYRNGVPYSRNHTLEFNTTDDCYLRMDLCRYQVERTGHTAKLLAATTNHHTRTSLSMAKMIVFPPGCYGSWVHWVLNHLSHVDTGVTAPPLSGQGDAHNWNNQNCFGHLTKDFMASLPLLNDEDLCRCHLDEDPVRNDIIETLNWILGNFSKTVYLYAEENSVCWMANVKLDKVWNNNGKREGFDHYFSKERNINTGVHWEFVFHNHNEILGRWPEEYDNNGMLSKWIIREYLSMVLHDSVYKNLSIDKLEHIKSLDLLPVNVVDLRDNFSNTIKKIATHLDIKIDDNISLDDLYQPWKDSQKHFFKDQLIHDIVNAIIDNKDLNWAELSIIDEALIQHYLRKRGYELKCHGLNEFPTNTKKLRELMYATQ